METFLEFIENENVLGFRQNVSNAGSLVLLRDDAGSTLVHATAIYSACEVLREIIEHVRGIKESKISTLEEIQSWINQQNNDGNTALIFAAMTGGLSIIKILHQLGAEINSYNLDQKNAIHFAAEKDYPHIISFLASHGAELTRSSCKLQTPIHLSVLMNSYKSTSLLLALRVTRKRQDENGYTALHLAAKNNNGRVVRLLLLKGFDPSTKDKLGNTAEDLATDPQIKELFHSAGILQLFGYRPMVADGEKKNYVPITTLCALIIVVFLVNSVFLEECKVYADNSFVTYLFAALSFCDVFLVALINLSDPGYLPKGQESELTVGFK